MNTQLFQKKLLELQEYMLNFARTLTSNEEDARDLLQETTLKVLDNQSRFADNINFKGWVLTIMRNIFINNYHKVLRSYTMINRYADLYNLDIMNDGGLGMPESDYQLKEMSTAISSLNEDLKIAFSMYLSGYKYHEIAEKLQIPMGTLKCRIFLARQQLQSFLESK